MSRLGVALLLLAACRAPAVDDVLGGGREHPTPVAGAEAAEAESPAGTQEQLDRAARAALEACAPDDADSASLVLAAQRLADAADLRVQRATWEWIAAEAAPDIEAVLGAGDRVAGSTRKEVEALCLEGERLCERVLARDGERADALQYHALHLALRSWAVGPPRALLAGLGPKVARAIDAAVAADASFDGGAPLRLSGRFRTQAPWPYRDLEKALVDLEAALELAAIPMHGLYLGDARWESGDVEGARAAWSEAVTAPRSEPRATAPIHRRLAQARLDAIAGAR